MSVRDFLGNEILYFDGAMGTRLQAAGLKPGELPEVWNITHGDVVAEIHASYVRAGANILKSNTFGANALKMKGSGYSVEDVVLAAFKNARAAFAMVAEECNVSEECNSRRSNQTGVASEQAGAVWHINDKRDEENRHGRTEQGGNGDEGRGSENLVWGERQQR